MKRKRLDAFVNKVIHGDCLYEMEFIPDNSIDMILCDLPYGTTACKWDTIIPLKPLWGLYKRIIKDNGAIVLTASQLFTTILINSNVKMFKYELIWNKCRGFSPQLANIMPMKSHENILIFGKGKLVYNPQKIKMLKPDKRKATYKKHNRKDGTGQNILASSYDKDKTYTDRFPLSIINISKNPATEKYHPTQKPVALFEYLIKTYTNENDIVLDNCAGSGTTGVACQNINRKFILIEKEKKYIDIINERLNY